MRRNTPDRNERHWIDDRAVSEVVGFVLVFAVIFGSVGLLYVSGFQAMGSYQETEQEINAERAMEALADNFNDVLRYDGIDHRQGEISLREGQIAVGDSGTTLELDVEGHSVPDDFRAFHTDEDQLDLGTFAYTTDSRTVAYEGGGLARSDDSSDWSSFFVQPHIVCGGSDTATISLVQIASDDRTRQGADGVELTITEQNRSTAVYNGVDDLSITIDDVDETPYGNAWNSFFEDDANWDGADGEWECNLSDGTVVVTIVEVDIEF